MKTVVFAGAARSAKTMTPPDRVPCAGKKKKKKKKKKLFFTPKRKHGGGYRRTKQT
jgi:hypothetical protein